MDLQIDKTKKNKTELIIENRVPLHQEDETFIFFMTNDYETIDKKLYSIGCREPELNDFIEDINTPYNIKKKMKDLQTCWALVQGKQDLLYYYDFEIEKVYKINIRTLTQDGRTTATSLMFLAIVNDKIDSIKYLVENGYDLTLYHGYGYTDFMISCLFGKYESARVLLELGSDINAKDVNNCTPLMHAVRRKVDKKIIELILSQNDLNINDKDIYGRTALNIAIKNKNYEAFKLLIENGADVNEIDYSGHSILMYSVFINEFAMSVYLIKHGANVNYQDKTGCTPLMIASYYGDMILVERLLEAGASNDYKDNNNLTAFIYAAKANKTRVLQILLDRIHISENEYTKALKQSVVLDNKKIVSLLIDKSSNPTGMSYLALIKACLVDNPNILKMCIDEKKCDPNIGLICEMSPLSIAIISNAIKVVQQLIALNVDINKADEDGITPLMYAASKNNSEITALLLKNGADINAKDKNGKTFNDYDEKLDKRNLLEIIDNRLKDNHLKEYIELHDDISIPHDIHTFGECFYWYKQRYLRKNPKKKDKDISEDGGLLKQYISFIQKKILKNPYFRPDDKYNVIRIAKGLMLNLEETEFFLHCSGYTFSDRNKKDKVIKELLQQDVQNIYIWDERIREVSGDNFFPALIENDDEYLEDMEMMKKLKKVVL